MPDDFGPAAPSEGEPAAPTEPLIPPDQPAVPVHLTLNDILDHLTTNAQALMSSTGAPSASVAASTIVMPDDPAVLVQVSARLANVTRLAGELQAELAALNELGPVAG
jgi:hypothetical protein